MSDKVRIVFVIKNAAGDYLARHRRFTPDFNKARIFKRKCDASNSLYYIRKEIASTHKVVLIDPH